MRTLSLSALSCLLLAGIPLVALAEDSSTTNAPSARAAAATRNRIPFQATVAHVDTNAMTFSIGGTNGTRVVRLDGESRMLKAGKPAVLSDVTAGDFARGLLKKNDRGEEILLQGTFGRPPGGAAKPKARPNTPPPTGPRLLPQ